jgi:hypothetical protein
MNTQQFLKGLLMTLISVVVTVFSTTPVDYVLAAVTAVCAVLTYTGKNLIPWLHSDSPVGALSLINIISGVLVALGTGLLNGVAQYVLDGVILWGVLWKVTLSVTFTYLGATLFAPPYSTKRVKFVGK